MKDKVVTAVVAAAMLGIYSASIYHFSSEDVTAITLSPTVAVPSPPEEGPHVDRIMRAMQTQGPSRIHTNLPVPGATCDITVSELATEYHSTDIEVDYCLDAVYAGLER